MASHTALGKTLVAMLRLVSWTPDYLIATQYPGSHGRQLGQLLGLRHLHIFVAPALFRQTCWPTPAWRAFAARVRPPWVCP